MNVLYPILGMAAVAIAVTALTYLGLCGLRRLMRRASERRVARRYRPGEIQRMDGAALFFGLGSRGTRQLRGNGVLVLTPSGVWFGAHFLRKELDIPLARIRAVGLEGSHLHRKVLGRKLLHVRFATEAGEDTAAWLVDEPRRWMEDIARWRDQARVVEGEEHGQGDRGA